MVVHTKAIEAQKKKQKGQLALSMEKLLAKGNAEVVNDKDDETESEANKVEASKEDEDSDTEEKIRQLEKFLKCGEEEVERHRPREGAGRREEGGGREE